MNRLISIGIPLIFLALSLLSCDSDSTIGGPNDSTSYTPSDSARSHFLLDATDFAVDYLFESGSPDTSKVSVPEPIVNRYLLPLAYLYDKRHEISLLDTLIIQQQIHKQANSSYGLIVWTDTTYQWVQNVRNQISPTGNSVVDSLVLLYGLSFEWGYGDVPWFSTRSRPLNMRALGGVLLTVPGVTLVESNHLINFYSKLDVIPGSQLTLIRFYLGYGDCPSGCFGYERWTYSVSKYFDIIYEGYLRR